jgi:SAM-dependent methyltransferase
MYNDFTRYLAAKRSVDDRALNRQVWGKMVAALSPQGAADTPLRVVEVGAGIGTMVERMVDWGVLESADYLALDALPANRDALIGRLCGRGFALTHRQPDGDVTLQQGGITVRTRTADLFAALPALSGEPPCDLLVAHAFLDLVDAPRTLPRLFHLLRPGGLALFTINFDGITALEPAIDPALDRLIERLYHATMDGRLVDGQPSGDSRSGRHLLQQVREAGGELLAAGSSDWVVFADGAGRYVGDEAYFLHFIVATIGGALAGHSELPAEVLAAWVARRHAMIERGELTYIAHQLDLLVRVHSARAIASELVKKPALS